MKKFLVVFLGIALGFSSVAQAVNVAVISPRAPEMARFGHDLVGGVQIAVDIINQTGGILGEKINLIEIEDRCFDNAEISTAKMISTTSSEKEKISLVIGPYCNNAFERISDLYAKGRVIRVTPMPLTLAQKNLKVKGLFKIGGLVTKEAEAFYSFYKKHFSDQSVAVVYDQNIMQTVEIAEAIQNLFSQSGLKSRMNLYEISSYDKKYSKMAKDILSDNQIVYLLGSSKDIAKTAQYLQEKKETVTLFTDEYMATGYFFKEMGNFVEGVYLLGLENLKDRPEFTEDLVQLRLSGKEPIGLGVYGYASVLLWKNMVEKARSFDFDKVVYEGENREFMLPWGGVSFDQGIISQNPGYQVYRIKNGEYTQVD